jgi:hypothetical protein
MIVYYENFACLCVLCGSAFNQNAKWFVKMKRNRKDDKNAKVRKDDYYVLCVTSVTKIPFYGFGGGGGGGG